MIKKYKKTILSLVNKFLFINLFMCINNIASAQKIDKNTSLNEVNRIESAIVIDSSLNKVLSTKQINLGYRALSIPISYDYQNEPYGFAVEICKNIIHRYNKDIKIKWVKIIEAAQRFTLINSKEIDAECGNTSITPERVLNYSFSMPFYVSGIKFLSTKNDNIQNVSQLKDKSVIATRNTTSYTSLKNLEERYGFKLVIAENHLEARNMLSQHKANVWVMDDIVLASHKALLENPNEWVISSEPIRIEPYAVLLHKDSLKLKEVFDKGVENLYKSGSWDILYSKWFENNIYGYNINLKLPKQEHIQNIFLNMNN